MKTKIRISLIGFSILLVMTGFQNCAQEGAFDSKSTESLELQSLESVILAPPPHVVKQFESVTTYETVLADRYLLKAIWENAFGPTYITKDSTNLYANSVDFGAPCASNESYFRKNGTARVLASTFENCVVNATNRIAAPLTPKSTVVRQALVTRACSDLTKDPVTLNFALKKIQPTMSTSGPDVTNANLLAAYKLFYVGKLDPHQGLIDALHIIANANGAPSTDSWASTLFTICASGYWQNI